MSLSEQISQNDAADRYGVGFWSSPPGSGLSERELAFLRGDAGDVKASEVVSAELNKAADQEEDAAKQGEAADQYGAGFWSSPPGSGLSERELASLRGDAGN